MHNLLLELAMIFSAHVTYRILFVSFVSFVLFVGGGAERA